MILYLFLILFCAKIGYSCSGFQTRTTCSCSYEFKYQNETLLRPLAFPIESYDDCGIGLGCEKKLDCEKYCREEINLLLGNDRSQFNQNAKNKICSVILNDRALNTSGLIFYSNWKYGTCENNSTILVSDLCCNRRCNCELVGQHKAKNLSTILDLTSKLALRNKGYSCSINEFDDCEANCRSTVADIFKNDEFVSDENKFFANYKILEAENLASEYVCKESGIEIKKPGIEAYIKISTDKASFNRVGKYLPIGQLCCKRKCECSLWTQNARQVSNQFEKSEFFEDLSNLVADRRKFVSFDCQNEELSCMNDCRLALAEYFQSDLIALNQTNSGLLTSNIDFFVQQSAGSRICEKLKRGVPDPGLNVYLRFSTNSKLFPFSEEMHVGRLCCLEFNPKTVYVPFNRCFRFPSP